eukprot:TRINITY_DN1616_c0_g1_i1.p1 TRINITY_DN1616_c0_g1~~TRINITY_DN1616_c0_g1_i1.p1  ORF type:complete len:221 (+),score=44.91 TRINITY_DN1616_c0_g1_i1:65-727(+)
MKMRAFVVLAAAASFQSAASQIPVPDVTPDQIINIGKQVWEIIKDSKPTANVTKISMAASGVPKGITEWTSLEGFNPAENHRFSLKRSNLFGIPVIEYDFAVSFLKGGSYNGTGAYLAEVRLVPERLWMGLGAGTMNAQVEITQVLNAGTKAAPVAAITIVHRYSRLSNFATNIYEDVFFVKGTGELVCQSGPSCFPTQYSSSDNETWSATIAKQEAFVV